VSRRGCSEVFRAASFVVVASTLASLLLTGCGTGLVFRQDASYRVLAPAYGAEVTLPVTLRWTPVAPGKSAGPVQYAIFIDQPPMSPGQTVRGLVDNVWRDSVCQATPCCPNAAYLSLHGVYLTETDHFTISALANYRLPGVPDRHNITIVVLDAHQRRFNEDSYYVDFVVRQ
jgi:hypothetical protein